MSWLPFSVNIITIHLVTSGKHLNITFESSSFTPHIQPIAMFSLISFLNHEFTLRTILKALYGAKQGKYP